MAAIAKGVALSFQLITATVSVHSALEPKISNTSACGGVTGKAAHKLTKIQQRRYCETCDTDVPYTEVRKAREVGGELVDLSAEEIKAAKSDADAFKKLAALTPHGAGEIESKTISGEKLYYLHPEKGQERAYEMLLDLVQRHPELVFMARWTPKSSAGTYALRERGDVLVLQERVAAAATKALPVIPRPAMPEGLAAMADAVLAVPGVITAFDPADYADTYEAKVQEILAAKTAGTADADVAPVVPLQTSVAEPADALLAGLAAMVGAAKAKTAA